MENQVIKIKRALISVSDKTGIVDFARNLAKHEIEILSTGGTYRLLQESGIAATEVSAYTEFPEMMAGRVKTLHPKIHGGILARRNIDQGIMQQQGIKEIDMVVVNLYPFAATIEKPDCDLPMAIENIDIGGPAMIRSAAKNYQDVVVVVNPNSYATLVAALDNDESNPDSNPEKNSAENAGGLTLSMRFDLAVSAFEHTALYDGTIANFLGRKLAATDEQFPRTLNLQFNKAQAMRYGENPHQNAAFYTDSRITEASVSTATQLQGKALSYNNIADTDAALECVKSFNEAACVIVKHANPCGVATAHSQLDAYQQAYQTDPTSAFGGIIAFNQPLEAITASAIIERQFVEVIIAPTASEEAIAVLTGKPNIRLLVCGEWLNDHHTALDYKRVNGGLLVQDRDNGSITLKDLQVVSKRQPTRTELQDLLFAWKVAKFVKSNAIVYAKDSRTIGIGAGQMSRIYSAKIAGIKAVDENLQVTGCVMSSDAFFPFRDGIDAAAAAGIRAVIQPGGSMRDDEVIHAADEAGMAMVFTGMRHFRH